MPKEAFSEGESIKKETEKTVKISAPSGDQTFEEFVKDLPPAAVAGMITVDTEYLKKMRHLRPLMPGETGKLWDDVEREAERVRAGAIDFEKRKDVLRRIEDLIFAVEEFDSLLEQRKKGDK